MSQEGSSHRPGVLGVCQGCCCCLLAPLHTPRVSGVWVVSGPRREERQGSLSQHPDSALLSLNPGSPEDEAWGWRGAHTGAGRAPTISPYPGLLSAASCLASAGVSELLL